MDDLYDDDVMLMTLNPEDLKPAWHRREEEPNRAYEYFQHYLLMGSERDLLQLAADLGINDRTLYQYNIKFQWGPRARAYDVTKNVVAEAADELLKTRIRQRIYDETTIIRDAFMESVLNTLQGGTVAGVMPYAYEILHEHGIEPSAITISAKIDMTFFRDIANILATLNRELKASKDMVIGRVGIDNNHSSPFDDMLMKLIQGGK